MTPESMQEKMQKTTPERLLRADHEKVKRLFGDFENAQDDNGKREIVHQALNELKVHAIVEEEIFYPAVREQLGEEEEDKETMDEAVEEHAVVKLLIEQLEGMEPDEERYDAKFMVLAEMVKHHIEEEESEMFPKAEDLLHDEELAARMSERKEEARDEMENEQQGEEPMGSRRRGRRSGQQSPRSRGSRSSQRSRSRGSNKRGSANR